MEKSNNNSTVRDLKDLNEAEKRLFELVQEEKIDTIKELTKSGEIRINCLDKDGMTPLDQACFKGNQELVEFFIENGADVDNRAHQQGYTALMFAALAGKGDICQRLLEAGANPSACNMIGKPVAELAAFVGQHECVSIISSYISYRDVDVILHPKGDQSDQIYPAELAKFVHQLTRTHAFHPVKLIFDIVGNDTVWKYAKKAIYTVDRLFEKQLRTKSPNEMLSLKLWLILYTLRELIKFVEKKKVDKEKSEQQVAQQFARFLLQNDTGDGSPSYFRPNEEQFVRQVIASFPYKQAMLWQTLKRQIGEVPFGQSPSAFSLFCQALLGARFVQTSTFCRTCWLPNANKRCKNCKTYYCSVECQRFDWPSHKKCCEALKEQFEQNIEETIIGEN